MNEDSLESVESSSSASTPRPDQPSGQSHSEKARGKQPFVASSVSPEVLKRLPDLPSAAEVEKNGIDIGDNQALLLKKVEELTLYLLDQNKRLELQQKEIESLKKWQNQNR